VILAAIIAYRTRRGFSRQPDREPLPWGWSVPLGIVGGIVSGLFGVGGALIVPPALTAFFGVRQVEGQGLGLALVAPGSVIALVAHAGAGQVDWRLGIPLAVGGVVAISAGVAFRPQPPRATAAFCLLWPPRPDRRAIDDTWVTATAVVYDAIRSVDREMRSR
jgi:uncharacterized protein